MGEPIRTCGVGAVPVIGTGVARVEEGGGVFA